MARTGFKSTYAIAARIDFSLKSAWQPKRPSQKRPVTLSSALALRAIGSLNDFISLRGNKVELSRTANQMRGFAADYGVCFPKKISMLLQGITEDLAKEQCGLSPVARVSVAELMEHIKLLTTRIDALMLQATELDNFQPAFKRLQTIPGIGPVISCTLMAAIGNGHQFDRGRSVAAWLGLVPRQNGSGGTTKLLGITKNGNRELRTLLIHGARTVLAHAKKHKDDKMGKWLMGLEARRGKNRAAVAYANKLARIAWSVIRTEKPFDLARAFR